MLRGVAITRGGIRLNLLFFAVDCIIFGRAVLSECSNIQNMLCTYEKVSRQCLNLQKTSLFFSSNTQPLVIAKIKQVASVIVYNNFEKYLELPSIIGISKYTSFKYLKGRVWLKIHSWKNKFISKAGKEILLKAVVLAISTFHISVFRLPRKLYKDIAAIMSRFWWGHNHNDKKNTLEKLDSFGCFKREGWFGI